ncbi:MAG: hypothetical protein OXR62_16200 [Ahrensia sp.]|nr:hypothetical protein [Ahrensia sp.]
MNIRKYSEKIVDEETGVVVFEAHYDGNQLHREDGPAWIERDRLTGRETTEWWYQNGLRHREDGPAVLEKTDRTGITTLEEHWQEGELIEQNQKTIRSLRPMVPSI